MTESAPFVCSYPDCQEPAQGRVATPVFLDGTPGGQLGFVIVRPLGTSLTKGAPCCVHHIHYAVDLTLLTADAA